MARGRRLLAKVLVALLGLALLAPALSAAVATTAYADPGSEEAQFLALTNQLRVDHGLNALASSGTLLSIARNWSANMAAAGGISHNMNLPNEVSLPWEKLGENVGTGSSVSSIQNAFINSPHHYENLVDPSYNYVGIGVVDSGGKIYVTVDFMAYSGQSAPAPAPAPAATRTTRAPAPVRVATPRPAATATSAPTTLAVRATTPPARATSPPRREPGKGHKGHHG